MKEKLIDMRLYKIANTENYDGPFLVKLRANIDNLKPVIYTSELSFVKIQKLLDYGFIYSKDDSKDGLEIIFDIDSNKFLSGYEPDNELIILSERIKTELNRDKLITNLLKW